MKVIDLLNKIANGEEVPKKIRYNGNLYFYCKPCHIYEISEANKLCGKDLYNTLDNLNDEIKIIEEEKELEEIEIQDNRIVRYRKDKFIESMFNHFYDMDLEVRKKLNDAIKEIKRIKKEGK